MQSSLAEHVPSFRRAVACERLLELAPGLEPCVKAPIHAALEWECLLERLDRLASRDEAKWAGKVEPILAEVERALGMGSSSAS
jgi:hypothetical protein